MMPPVFLYPLRQKRSLRVGVGSIYLSLKGEMVL